MAEDPREHLARIARLVYARGLNDASGGNLSLRQGDRIFTTPCHAGSHQQWQITPQDIVVLDLEGNILEGPDRRTREWQLHLGLYRHFSQAGGVVHAQAGYFMAFVAAGREMPPVLEHTQKFGTIRVARSAPAHSAELAQNAVAVLDPQKQELGQHAIAAFLPQHGVVVVGRDLDDAFDTLERLETNARAIIQSSLLR